MIPSNVRRAVNEALKFLPKQMDSPEARVLMYAIGIQESGFIHRFQIVEGRPKAKGPARGFWQFERGGGCAGVVRHLSSRYWMSLACKFREVKFNSTAIWKSIESDDVLAAIAARLLIFTDPKRLPVMGDERGAWNLYIRTWRPGIPRPEEWSDSYARALFEVGQEKTR